MQKGIDYIGVGVGAAIFNNEGKLLLTLRGKEAKNERGKWEIPGGSVEFGETFKQALRREIREELDIKIDILELLNICDHIGWYSIDEAEKLPLSIVTLHDIATLKEKFPHGYRI